MIRAALISAVMALPAAAQTAPETAIGTFNAVCFKAGQTATLARTRMETRAGSPLPFDLTFWDITLEPANSAPAQIERRCEVAFAGDHTAPAIAALRVQMAMPPVFGHAIPLPATHRPQAGTALIEARALLRGRIAVVHIGTRSDQTFMAVDRLPADWEDR
ncbi:hypothetical protein ROLI_007850 [Roseobacter fucihabitans]|uniref:Uncharacterized protein n=1 Tax=Roseobacter fucihabitans TaxID=1537242 RepID=A0ABZ2BNZ8_9RHOB|nr:hypothetical protein [Roseobacter litoralis]MBC6966047.1 hypothetical protein [Roseobacter litoralis]